MEKEEKKLKKKEEREKEKELKSIKFAKKQAKIKEWDYGKNSLKRNASPKKISRQQNGKNAEDSVEIETPAPFGEKKVLSSQIASEYCPNAVEKSWYAWWEESGFFLADAKSSKPPFSIVLPPPNVTGVLHIGHALTSAIEDTIVRFKRMSGYNTLWVPGVDHAGIATQVVVEKKLMRERNLTRHDIGRENFTSEVWKWKEEHGGTILKQLRLLGASLDFSHECFTMDEKRSKAVIEEFVRLFQEGLIYRAHRIINWDCTLRTAISDIEVEYIDINDRRLLNVPGYEKPVEFGVLTSFAYPLEEGLGEIVVATTRPETMLGDTAIAVHPDDQRYVHLKGKFAIHPFDGRRIPIIFDDAVKQDFGTGAVKITPAHDRTDFEVGRRHHIEFIDIFTDDGKINNNGGLEFTGMPRFEAREAITEALKKKGLYRGAETNRMQLGLCSRSKEVLEPRMKSQWFVDCKQMAKKALDAPMDAENLKIEFIPQQYLSEWDRWLGKICDWCISRQLWWGHQIPAWYITLEDDELKEFGAYNDHWVVGRFQLEAEAEACLKFSGKKFEMTQDPDVLDTWFSSGLYPLSALGWPEETDDLKTFYPTSVLETGYDILFFWVARMVMLGMKLGGDVPFSKVILHPIICDAHGRKMSKSLGNVIDPIDIINGITLEGLCNKLENSNLDTSELAVARAGVEKDFPNGIPECGADALRFALIIYTTQSDKINLDIQRVVGYRQWCNKLWNVARFALNKFGVDYVPPCTISLENLPFSCKWILSVLNKTISQTVSAMNGYDLSTAAETVYFWWQYEFCDVFIESIKPFFAGDDPTYSYRRAAQDTLWVCLDTGLRLLHPFMPFITEELWQRLPSTEDQNRECSIVISAYPSAVEAWFNERVESDMYLIESTAQCIRSLRANVHKNKRAARFLAFILCQTDEISEIITAYEREIMALAKLSSLKVLLLGRDAPPVGCAVENVTEHIKVYLQFEGDLNAEEELENIRNKMNKKQREPEDLEKKIYASGYKESAPKHVQKKLTEKLTKLLQELEFFRQEIARLEGLNPR